MSEALERLWAQIAARWQTGELLWFAVGMAAQGAFFLRFLWQWLASEKAKKSVVPRAFWYASLIGGLLLLSYAVHRRNPVFTLSQAAGVIIYLRNIHLILKNRRQRLLLTAGVIAAAALLVAAGGGMPGFIHRDAAAGGELEARTWGALGAWWVAFGMVGNVIFFMRFVIQWIMSERRGESVVPLSFWYVSVGGGAMLLAYAIADRDVVLSLGQGVGLIVYLRNIMLSAGQRGKSIAFGMLVALWSALLFLPGLGSVGLWKSGEARVAEIALEMRQSGDYVMPHINGKPALTKPPLYHWLACASYSAFGVGEMGARFPSAVAAVLTAILVYLMGHRMLGSTGGLLAGLMTATALEFASNARAARTDMVYTFFVVAAVAAFYHASLGTGRARRLMLILFFACMGLAFMTKGPAGIVIPLVSGLGYLALTGRRSETGEIPWFAGLLVFGVIAVPWHIAVALRAGDGALWHYFWQQMANWTVGNTAPGSVWHVLLSSLLYVPYFIVAFLPWSFVFPAAAVLAAKAARSGQARYLALPLVWLVVGIAAFAFSGTKAVRYLTVLIPAAALVTAWFWREAFPAGEHEGYDNPQATWWVRLSVWPMALAATLAAAAVAWPERALDAGGAIGILGRLNTADGEAVKLWTSFLAAHRWASLGGAAVLVLTTAWGAYQAWHGRVLRYFVLLALAETAGLALFFFALLPLVERAYGVKSFAESFRTLSAETPYGWVNDPSLELLFYMGRGYDAVDFSRVKEYVEKDPRALVLVWDKDIERIPPQQLGFVGEYARGRIRHREVYVFGSPWRPPNLNPVAGSAVSDPRR